MIPPPAINAHRMARECVNGLVGYLPMAKSLSMLYELLRRFFEDRAIPLSDVFDRVTELVMRPKRMVCICRPPNPRRDGLRLPP